MPSPFPGMDPYLEGYLWPDVHHRLATQISRQLTPRLRPRYVARLEISVVEDSVPEIGIGLMVPDVEVVTTRRIAEPLPTALLDEGAAETTLKAPLVLPVPEVRLATVEIRDVAQNQLVTSIEILSPINKREPGLSRYREKRYRLRQAAVHLLEIDLLRRGTRPFSYPQLSDVAYLVTLTRAEASVMEAWPIRLQDRLPPVPIPLLTPDPDVPLELSLALSPIYDEAAYDLSIDYHQPLPAPPPSDEDAEWVKGLFA